MLAFFKNLSGDSGVMFGVIGTCVGILCGTVGSIVGLYYGIKSTKPGGKERKFIVKEFIVMFLVINLLTVLSIILLSPMMKLIVVVIYTFVLIIGVIFSNNHCEKLHAEDTLD